VRVRVLVDDGDTTAATRGSSSWTLSRHAGSGVQPVRVQGHNRILRNLDFVVHKKRLDYRMHNKLMIADNAIALVAVGISANNTFRSTLLRSSR